MIEKGVNPYVVQSDGQMEFRDRGLSYLNIPEMDKSVYFSIYPNESYPSDLQEAWIYTSGSFPGNFEVKIGEGSEGIVLLGEWMDNAAAFKFVEIQVQDKEWQVDSIQDSLGYLNKRLTEVNELKTVDDTNLIKFYGHYR